MNNVTRLSSVMLFLLAMICSSHAWVKVEQYCSMSPLQMLNESLHATLPHNRLMDISPARTSSVGSSAVLFHGFISHSSTSLAPLRAFSIFQLSPASVSSLNKLDNEYGDPLMSRCRASHLTLSNEFLEKRPSKDTSSTDEKDEDRHETFNLHRPQFKCNDLRMVFIQYKESELPKIGCLASFFETKLYIRTNFWSHCPTAIFTDIPLT